MKTAISIPEDVFRRAERTARKLGLSRSELYARAVRSYLEAHQAGQITKTLDRIYACESSRLNQSVSRMQSASIPREAW